MNRIALATLVLVCLAVPSVAAPESAPCPTDFPPGNAAGTRCFFGQDGNGAYYMIVIPPNWEGTLVLHDHGGPSLTPPKRFTNMADLLPAAQMLKFGWAVAASSYRDGGFHIRLYAEDTENLRRIFVATFGTPRRTIVSGVSFGAMVANKVMELYDHYDGGMQACGALAGVRRTYYQRLDARVIYQHYCGNLPRADESDYPLYKGLPPDSPLTAADVRSRVDECTGILLPALQRSARQQKNLANILNVLRVPESELLGLMSLATFSLRELSMQWKDRNALPNADVVYDGSTDDAELNATVARYEANAAAALSLLRDSDPTGKILTPVMTIHSINDGIAVVEQESAYREAFERAGTAGNLQQTFVSGGVHSSAACGLNPTEYIGTFNSLANWIRSGSRPSEETVIADCESARATAPAGLPCRIVRGFRPESYESRVRPRSMWSIPNEKHHQRNAEEE